jgi:hypothetical protein
MKFTNALKVIIGLTAFTLDLYSGWAEAQNAVVNVALNRAAYQSSASDFDHVAHLATDGSLDTYWQSGVENQPWIYVDLGQPRKINSVKLAWGSLVPSGGTIQVSNETSTPTRWTDVGHIACTVSVAGEVHFPPMDARFVRMLADTGSAPGGCQLKEFKVEGEPPAAPAAPDLNLPPKDENDKISLDGAGWKLQNAMFVSDTGETISKAGYSMDSWLVAKVPGTVLNSYLLDGAIPDPNFGDQQALISESFFQNDFWYRKEFLLLGAAPHQHFLLNFEGINWKADIYVNGTQVGHIDGAFSRGQFEVTQNLLPGQKNVLAVLIHKVANPGPTNVKLLAKASHNGGILGRDNPTFHASLGWNWMPSIRGRDTGIWDHVYLQQTGPLVLKDPFVQTAVSADRKTADLTIQLTLENLEYTPVEGTVNGTMGNIAFAQKVQLAAHETKTLNLDKTTFPQLSLQNPALWWPNGYGDQPLQHLQLAITAGDVSSCHQEVVFGIRQLTYVTSNNILKIFCNGQFIQLNGGNWGMDETMLRYEAKDYDIAVRLHKEMNMTMIRNWVGQVGKEEFFDACDKYGLLVWNDFWLANPSDGPNPDDHKMFMDNVHDRILRIRNHPSLALYCGRNEGMPPKDLDQGMAQETTSLDGSRFYIPQSAGGLVTGHGPYEPRTSSWYFKGAEARKGGIGTSLHSELGIVCVPTADTMRLMMPEEDLWPISDMWATHDYFQPRCRTYTARINTSYGAAQGLDDFCEKAQMENWENAKAMFESWRSLSGSGCLAWMSHPAWPSLICQFYDYYLNPTAAYFGARIANEPLHILWDSFSNKIKVANNTGKDFKNLQAEAWIYNMDGTQAFYQKAQVNSSADGIATDCFDLTFPANLSPVHFIKLILRDATGTVSQNFYWRGVKEDDYVTLNSMPKVNLVGSSTEKESDGKFLVTVRLENPTANVALMACVKVVKSSKPTERILPIFYRDNYVSLLPHETRQVEVEFDSAALQGDKPKIIVEGWNTPRLEF